ncbi:unnamed protein product [Effrenium voratum]|nr:unnamed protein product [Effrenium voratum]
MKNLKMPLLAHSGHCLQISVSSKTRGKLSQHKYFNVGEGTAGMSLAVELGTEFELQLEEVKPFIALTRPDIFTEPEPDDGWHQPPDFRLLDLPFQAQDEREEEQVAEERAQSARAREASDINVSMKLHSVAVEDTQSRSEILLLEKCAMIIAEECGIPRQWISNLCFKPGEELAAVSEFSVGDLSSVQVDM